MEFRSIKFAFGMSTIWVNHRLMRQQQMQLYRLVWMEIIKPKQTITNMTLQLKTMLIVSVFKCRKNQIVVFRAGNGADGAEMLCYHYLQGIACSVVQIKVAEWNYSMRLLRFVFCSWISDQLEHFLFLLFFSTHILASSRLGIAVVCII